MCGIAGIIAFDGRPLGPGVEAALRRSLAPRGPDGSGAQRLVIGAASALLVHTRLAVIDLSDAAAEPLPNEDETAWLVCNGELYGHTKARRALEARGHRFRSDCDAENAIHLYEEVGFDLASRLHGMYALAIADTRRGSLLLARDPAGQKPLFVAETSEAILFASDPATILAGAHAAGITLDRSVDAEALDAYLAVGYVPAPLTLLRGIRSLCPGESALWLAGRWTHRRGPGFGARVRDGGEPLEAAVARARGSFEPARPAAPAAFGDPAHRLRALVDAAVGDRLVSDAPLGAFLSGGIDSTIVTSAAQRLAGRRLRTFSIGFEEPRWDESRFARIAATAIGTEHTEAKLGSDIVEALPAIVMAHGQAFADESALAVHHLARLARRDVTVVLSGDGGDELFSGYRHHRVASALRALDRLVPRAARQAIASFAGGVRGYEKTRLHQVTRLLSSLGQTEGERYLTWSGIFPGRGAAIAARVHAEGGVGGYDRATYLPGDLLRKLDRQTMSCGLEARSPLLDGRVAAFAAELSERRKSPAPWKGKELLKRAYADALPPALRDRPKMGFGVPITRWLRTDASVRDRAQDLLVSGPARARGISELADAERLLREHREGVRDHARRIYSLCALELFFRQVVDPSVPTSVRW